MIERTVNELKKSDTYYAFGISKTNEQMTRYANKIYLTQKSKKFKAKSIFDTLHLHFPKRRIVIVFEPHAFVWRNRKLLKWYRNIFNNVDEVVMLPATSHGKGAKDQLSTSEVWREAKKYKNIHTVRNEKEGLNIIKKIVKKIGKEIIIEE